MSKKWSIKCDIFNGFKKTNYFSSNDNNNLGVKTVKMLEKIKEWNISIKKMVTIKLINGLSNSFEDYLIILNKKARNNNKLPNLQAFFWNLKDKKHCINKTLKSILFNYNY